MEDRLESAGLNLNSRLLPNGVNGGVKIEEWIISSSEEALIREALRGVSAIRFRMGSLVQLIDLALFLGDEELATRMDGSDTTEESLSCTE